MQRSWAMKKDRQDKNRLRGNISSAVMLAGAAFVLLFSSSAAAQDRVELTGIFGYTFSEGFETDPGSLVSELIEKVNPTSGYAYGAGIDVFVTEQAQVGFLWTQQDSMLELETAIGNRDVTGMNVNNYHAVFTYNLGFSDAPVRPFFTAGWAPLSMSLTTS